MLTPAFELRQDEDFITIIIKAPFAKISETEIFIEDCEFKFYSKPYYLRLSLPGSIVEDGRETAEYKAETGVFDIRVAKTRAGRYFDGLDMLTKLLAPSGHTSAAAPLIEALDDEKCQDEDEQFDWQIEQCAYDEETVLLTGPRYGFANQRSGLLQRLQTEIPDLIDLANADGVLLKDRRELRLADEQEQFDDDYYIADLYENEAVESLLDFRPWWEVAYKKAKSGAATEDVVVFTKAEQEKMRQLPRKEYVLDERDKCTAFLGLVDIIFAYAYDHRTTEGENNVESGWTIRKLSATLSWLETYSRPEEAVTASYRRCLSYPLFRHWKLTTRVFRDVRHIFSAGRRCLLKSLLDIHSLLMDGDSRYILNDLYITDYCGWIQQVSEKKLSSLARSLAKLKITKGDIGFELELLERAAELAVEEQQEAANQVTDSMAAMIVTSEIATRGSECQKESGKTNDEEIAKLTSKLQINKGSDEIAEKAASCAEGNNTKREEDKHQKVPKCNREEEGKGRESILESPGNNDCSFDVQNIKIGSDIDKVLVVSCLRSSEVAISDCGSEKHNSHDAVESQEQHIDDSRSESSCQCSSCQDSDDTDADSSNDTDTCSKSAKEDQLVRPQETTVTRSSSQDSPRTQMKDQASLNF